MSKLNNKNQAGAVLVVGGGIAGMQAASDLADSGFIVYLLTADDALGGRMAKLDKTFPTNECSMCLLGPRMTGAASHNNIFLLTKTTLIQLNGEPGNFTAIVKRHPRYIDEAKCTGCGQCAEACPVKVPDEFNECIGDRRAIYKQFPQAVPNKFAIDKKKCINCKKCVRVCTAGAIDHHQQPEQLEITVGAVILTPGFESFDAGQLGQYGLGHYPNVVSNIQFERMLSSTGPTKGMVCRPSDQQVPTKIAFIQCVGSRSCRADGGAIYCSSICCMASVKEAVITKEQHRKAEITIFFLDMRAYGKNFDRYVERAAKQGIKFQRSLVPRIKENSATDNLVFNYCSQGQVVSEEFELVVLGAGVRPPSSAKELAAAAGIELNDFGFALTSNANPVQTTRAGVFAAGGFLGPRDIPETVINGSAAAAAAGELLTKARGTQVQVVHYPPERYVSGHTPRVGVFVCHCGTNIAGVVDVPAVVGTAGMLNDVVIAKDFTHSCSQQSLQQIKKIITEHRLNRVVVAACSARTHLALFRRVLREVGLNQYYLEMANIRDQCSWVHRNSPDHATAKARALVAAAVGKVRYNQALQQEKVPVQQSALVVGGGIAGMTAALSLANQGFPVYLLERQLYLGGILRQLYLPQGEINPQKLLQQNIEAVMQHPNVTVYNDAQLFNCKGSIGQFQSEVQTGSDKVWLEHGAIIVATGSEQFLGINEYLYGIDNRVITRLEMEQKLATARSTALNERNIVFIQCVGSRQQQRNYCSRSCCGQTVRQALEIKRLHSEANVYVLYRDIRTYGLQEQFYLAAREKGVIFINYHPDAPPVIQQVPSGLNVNVYDPTSRQNLHLETDLVVLANAAVLDPATQELASLLRIPLNEDGFFVETHAKLSPLDATSAGIYICGAAHSPQNISEAIAQGRGAAARVATILSKEILDTGGVVARVDGSKCAACLTCVRECPYSIPSINHNNVAEINAAQCQGCGICAAACPNRAILLEHYHTQQLVGKMQFMFQKEVTGSERF